MKGVPMDKMIASCGIDCAGCPALEATRNNDYEAKKKIAEDWSKQYEADIKPEDINCVGCVVSEGRHIGHWYECEIRKCAVGRGLNTCAECDEYSCEKLTRFFEFVPDAKENLDALRHK
jgi:imidazoleglycerol phosphate dehydratase HisB